MHRRAARVRVPTLRQAIFQQISEHSAGAQPQQRNRNRKKREVVEQHDRKQSGERQLQQQRRKTGEPQAREQRAFRNLSGRRNRRDSLNDCGHNEFGMRQSSREGETGLRD